MDYTKFLNKNVIVKWLDVRTYNDKFTHKQLEKLDVLEVEEFGKVVAVDDRKILLAHAEYPEEKMAKRVTALPLGMIVEIIEQTTKTNKG